MGLRKIIGFSNLRILLIAIFIVIQIMNGQKAWGDNLASTAAEPKNHEELPPNTLVITSQELESGVYGYDLFDVLAVLKIKTGITVKSSSDVGAEDWLLIRGLPRDSSRNVLVIVDGMPLNDAFSEANEFEHIPPVDLIEKIVVYKPPMPVRFGGYTAAIEIFTKGKPEENETEISGAVGGYKSGFLSLTSQGGYKNFYYRSSIDYLRTDNLTGVRRTPPNEQIVYGDRSYWKIRPAVKLMYDFSENSQVSLYAQYVESKKMFSDEIFRDEEEKRQRRLSNFILNYAWKLGEDSGFLFSVFRSDESYKLNLMMHPSVRDQKRYKQGVRLNLSFDLSARHRISFGGSFTDLYTQEKKGTSLSLTDANFFDLYLEDKISILDNANLILGLRVDDHSEEQTGWNPYISIVYGPFDTTSIFGIWGKSTRWPSLSEFDSRNPEIGLEGEAWETFELGMAQRIGKKIAAKVSFFHLELERESKFFMDFTHYPPSFYQRNEPDKLRSFGIEAEMNVFFTKDLKGYFSYTFNDVQRRPGGDPVDFGGPQNLANVGLVYARGKRSLSLMARYGSKTQGIQRMMGHPTELNDWLILDLAGKMQIIKNLSLFFRTSNVLDTSYETFDGRPMFGRTIVGGINVIL